MFRAYILLAAIVSLVSAGLDDHTYTDGEEVVLFVDKVYPVNNRMETYPYYSLPFCAPAEFKQSAWEGLGEALQGYDLTPSLMKFHFKDPKPRDTLCHQTLDEETYEKFRRAVSEDYWYQQFMDDLPIWGIVGDIDRDGNEEEAVYVYTHARYDIAFNKNQVIEVNLTAEDPEPISVGTTIIFTYEANWVPTTFPFANRFSRYLDATFFEHQIHWFSIFNSFMMVLFLAGLVSMILMRTLKKDYARFAGEDLEDRELDESGWKQVHGDVFRSPPHLLPLSVFIGTGYQLLFLVYCVIMSAIVGTYYSSRGTMLTAIILSYAFTSFIGGYGGGGYYLRNGGTSWIKCMLLTAAFYPGLVMGVSWLLNFIAVYKHSLSAISTWTQLIVFAIWLVVCLPLTVVGTVIGRNFNGQPNAPCRINQVPRHIPERPWYLSRTVHVLLGGLLPFGSIFIEMYFVFTSFWHHKYYYVYGFMLLVFIILVIVTVCVTIVSTYFLLNSEDYRWQWTAFFSGASTGLYVFIYCIYYFFTKTGMTGTLQITFYFGYMGLFCVGLGVLTGSIGFIGASVFVRRIYQNIKVD